MKVLIVAGGTGGHICPALALGEALAANHPDAGFEYLCGRRPVELRIYADNGVEPLTLPARQVGGGLAARLLGWSAAVANLFRTAWLIMSKRYDVVVGMGGYVSGPAVMAGVLLRRRTVLHEANSVAGKANRWLAPWVTACGVHFEAAAAALGRGKTTVVGMPVRASIFRGARGEGVARYGLDPARRTVVVTGGSQGARNLYRRLAEALPALDTEDNRDIQLLWSTGRDNFEELRGKVDSLGLRHLAVRLEPYLEMDKALAAADGALARAGASTIAEFVSLGIHALYVPLPSAIYDHQSLNAREAVRHSMGAMAPEAEFHGDAAVQALRSLFGRVREMEGRRFDPAGPLDSRGAAARLARLALGLEDSLR